LLLPALARAKEKGKRAACLNNQRQLSLVWIMYAGDNNDALVSNGMTTTGGDANNKMWLQGAFYDVTDQTNSALILDPKYALFAQYIRSPGVYHCPADRLWVQLAGVNYLKIRSYSMNAFLGWQGEWDDRLCTFGTYKIFHKVSELNNPTPAALFVFQDVQPDSICWPYFGVTMAPPGGERFFNFPGTTHNDGAVVGFADGHAERHRWLDGRTIAAQSTSYHSHSESSSRNQDVLWLEQHTTSAAP
jgi:prepilin-type processing-associated H-X9-DG protein